MSENKNNKKSDDKIRLFIPLNKTTLKYTFAVIVFVAIISYVFVAPEKILMLISGIVKVFSPFIIGLCLAYIINILLRPVENLWDKIWRKTKLKSALKCRRAVCLTLSTLLVFGAVFAILFMVIPSLKETVITFIDRAPQYINSFERWYGELSTFLGKYNFEMPDIELQIDKMGEFFKNFASTYGNSVLNTTVNVTTSIVSVVVNLVLGIAFSIYVLAQKEKIGCWVQLIIYAVFKKSTGDRILKISSLTNSVFTKFVTGQLTEAVIIGVLCFAGMVVLKIPYAMVISVLVGFTALIPVFGAFFGTAFGAFLILFESPQKAFWFVVFIIILQQLEGNLIYPRVVGKSVGMPGMLVLVAVTVGGSLFSVLGMLFSVPICSVVYAISKEFIIKRLEAKKLVISPEIQEQEK